MARSNGKDAEPVKSSSRVIIKGWVAFPPRYSDQGQHFLGLRVRTVETFPGHDGSERVFSNTWDVSVFGKQAAEYCELNAGEPVVVEGWTKEVPVVRGRGEAAKEVVDAAGKKVYHPVITVEDSCGTIADLPDLGPMPEPQKSGADQPARGRRSGREAGKGARA